MSRLATLLWLVTSLISGSAFAQSEIRWVADLATARRAAAQFQVPILIHFYGDDCLPCKTLEQRVLNQDSVIKTLNKYFICVRINASQDRETRAVAAEFQVHSWPTDVFVSPDGQVLYQGVCKQDIPGYMDVLQSVAISNRDRNMQIATERAKQLQQNQSGQNQAGQTQLASSTEKTQLDSATNSLPPLDAKPSNSSFAASSPITTNTPAAQFQVAPPSRPTMMDSNVGLPPLAGKLASKPLGSDGLGSGNSVSGQMNAQKNLPTVAIETQKQPTNKPTASLVSNPYYPETEAMVCTPDGKCGPASSIAPFNPLNTAQQPAAPTFQPKSATLVGNTRIISNDASTQPSTDSLPGLIEVAPQELEPAAYNGFCPISLVKTGLKVQGKTEYAVRHRGRTYLMESPEAVREFMQTPDRYSPVLSGYDPMTFLETGKLVDGSLEHALYDPNSGMIILFSSAESQTKFKADPVRNTKALGYILNAATKK